MLKRTTILLMAGLTCAMIFLTAVPSEAIDWCSNCYRKNVTDDWGLDDLWYDANCCFVDDPWCTWRSQGYSLSTANRRYCSIGSTQYGYYCRGSAPICEEPPCLTDEGDGMASATADGGEAAACKIEVGAACPAECGTCERNS